MVFLTLLTLAVGGFALLTMGCIGLFEAPWQILLALLVGALVGLQWLTYRSQAVLAASESSTTPASTSTDGQQSSNQRSPRLLRASATAVPASEDGAESPDSSSVRPKGELIYRGIPYQARSSDPKASQPLALDSSALTVVGVYRGHPWQRAVDAPASAQVPDVLIYRGRPVKRSNG